MSPRVHLRRPHLLALGACGALATVVVLALVLTLEDRRPIEIDCALAASLLLVRWEAPGASDRLFDHFREAGNTWLFDWLCGEFLPEDVAPRLHRLAESGPTRYRERCHELLGKLGSWTSPDRMSGDPR